MSDIKKALDEIYRLQDLLREAERDAKRYRHIRGMFGFSSGPIDGIYLPGGYRSKSDIEQMAKAADLAIDHQIALKGEHHD